MKDRPLCDRTAVALLAAVERGEAPSAELRQHWAICPRCRAQVEAVAEVAAALVKSTDENGDVTNQPVEGVRSHHTVGWVWEAVARQQWRWTLWRSLSVILVAGVVVVWLWAVHPSIFPDAVAALLVGTALAVPLVVALLALRRLRTNARLYKRIRPGYQISGVCLGLAERTGVSVQVWRLAFVLLSLFKGTGLFLYVLLDVVMPIHPEDRVYLLRFRLARWLQRVFRRPAHP